MERNPYHVRINLLKHSHCRLIYFWHGGTTLIFILDGVDVDDQYNAPELKFYFLNKSFANPAIKFHFAETEQQVDWKCVLTYKYRTACLWTSVVLTGSALKISPRIRKGEAVDSMWLIKFCS